VESCIITKWLKHPGDAVGVGDVLFSYETDKAALRRSAKVAGTLLAAFFRRATTCPA
jgi:pyruvate dehydrogenase E2 component (dihydrolipoamide acetyltransferase)